MSHQASTSAAHPGSPGRPGLAAGACALAAALIGSLAACSSSTPPRPADDPLAAAAFETMQADSSTAQEPVEIELDVDESLLKKLLRTHSDLAELDELYTEGSRRYAARELDLAEEHFFLLRTRTDQIRAAHQDSLALLFLDSIERRLEHFSDILAEERFFADSYAPVTQTLTESFDSLRVAYHIPDFILPRQPETPDSFAQEVLAVDNAQVKVWEDYFKGRGREHFQRWLERRERVGPIITKILDEEGLPRELLCLAMIESGLHPTVRSRAGAVGYWQFIRGTARNHGLAVNEWVDERRDLERSTRAACLYLRTLHGMFQNWPLALAGYNAGEYRIQRAIALQGHNDYWRLPLPRQTREYVPKLIACWRLMKDPAQHGFAAVPPDTLRYDVITLDDAYGLDQIAKSSGVSEAELRELNPQLLSGCTPPNQKDYRLRVPAGTGERVSAAVSAIPEGERLTWRQHRVQRGETLGQIARRYQTSVEAIMDLNGIRNARGVRSGRVLTIPYPRGVKPPAPTQVAAVESAPRPRSPQTGSAPSGISEQTHDRVDYRVRKGDTLYSIGQRFGVGVKDLVSWNRLPRSGRILAGDILQIWQRRVAAD